MVNGYLLFPLKYCVTPFPLFQKILKKTDGTHPFPTCLLAPYTKTTPELFYDFFGSNSMAIEMGCDGVASVRV